MLQPAACLRNKQPQASFNRRQRNRGFPGDTTPLVEKNSCCSQEIRSPLLRQQAIRTAQAIALRRYHLDFSTRVEDYLLTVD